MDAKHEQEQADLKENATSVSMESYVYIHFYAPRKISRERIIAALSIRMSVPHLFPGHNFVVCGWIKILFGTNDRQNKMTCR